MSDADSDQKTEQPSSKRLDEAREHGQVPISRETSTWIAMLGILVVVAWQLPPLMRDMMAALRVYLESPHMFYADDSNLQALMLHTLGQTAMGTGIAFGLLMGAVIAGVMVQTGFFFALDLLTPDFSRLHPAQGLKRVFSLTSLVQLIKSMGKMVFLGGICFSVIAPIATQAPGFTGMPMGEIFSFLHRKIIYLTSMVLLGFTVIAVGDLFYTRFSYIKGLRMTKTELKDEVKQQEGDPMIKSRLRQLRAERARKRMIAQIPKADVIITNPTHYAIALQYDAEKMAAPVVLAKGINLIAERIREVALENKVPLVSNPPLARALHDTTQVDQQIPAQYYRAVAEIISYVYKLRKRKF